MALYLLADIRTTSLPFPHFVFAIHIAYVLYNDT